MFHLMLEKDEMVAEPLDVQTEQTRILIYNISYNNYVTTTTLWHTENSDIAGTVYSDIFRHILEHSGIFSYL